MDLGNDLNRSTGNLGGDVEGLEEGGLSGLHTSVAGGNVDVVGGVSSSLGGGGDLVGEDQVTDLLEVSGGEDESDVSLDVGEEALELGVVGQDETDSTANHGVLSHQDLSLAAESLTNLVHLVRSDVVNVDDEDGGWT